MAAFNLTAQLNITGPNNLKPVISNIRKQLSSVTGTVNIKIDPKVTATANGLSQGLQNLNSSLIAISSSAKSAASAMGQFAAAMNSMNIKSVPRDMAAITQQSQKLQTQQAKTAAAVAQSSNSMVEFGKQSALAIRRFAAFTLVTGIIFKFTNSLGQASSEFMKFNSQLVQLSQVTGTSLKGLEGLEQTITGLSTSLGVSSSSLIDVSSTLAQAGLSARETEQALKALALSTLAPSFGDLNETVEGSIALMRQFSISTAQLEAALGSINSVAAKFAVEADDIIVAIQRTGGVFAAASKGVAEGSEALNQFIALFTSVRATTRESAETIATGLRTIFTRIQRSETIELLKRYGIQLTDLEGKFVGPYEAVKRLSMGLAGLDTRDIRFSSIIEELGGFRQVGKVIPLLQQFSTAEKALGVAQRGQTSLTGDAAKAQQALAIQMMKVQEEFVALVRSIGSSQQFQTMVKVALDLASALISIADASKHALPAIAGLLAVKGTIGAFRFASGFASGMRRGGGASGLGERMSGAPRGYATGGQIRRYSGGTGRRGVEVALTPGEVVLDKAVGGIGRTLNRAADSPSVLKQFSPTKKSIGGNVSAVPGSGHGDIVRARLAEGGFVVKRQSVEALGGPENIAKIISNKYGLGGTVQAPISKLKTQSKGGPFIRQYQEKHSDVMQDLDMAESVKINRENISLTKQDFEYLKAKALRHDRNYSEKKGKKGTWSTFNKTVWAEGFEKIARKRKGAGWKRTARTGDYGGDSAPVDLINNNGEFAEVKFTHEDRPVSDTHLLNKLLRYKIMSSGDDPKRIGFTPKVGEEVRLGEITVVQPTNKDEFLQFFSPQNYKGKKKKRVNLGGIIQQFEDGGYVQKLGVGGKPRSKKEPFGTGSFPFPKRIQNAYVKQEQKRLHDEQIQTHLSPRGERIVLDSAKVHEEYDKPFDREQFGKTFEMGVDRGSLHGNIARLAKHIGLPKENLDDIIPQHIDFMGANTGGLGAFRRRLYGGRKAEDRYDLTKYGFSKGDEQDLFGYDKLIEEKTKQIRKIVKTPVRTYDDGSFSYDNKAYNAANEELASLKNLRYKLSSKRSEAISLLTKEKEQIVDTTGKGFISLSENPFGFGSSIKNKVLYHELTHQLLNSIRVKNPKAFEQYQKSVAGKLQDDSLADEFDALPGFGYKSADVAYGRSYKLSGLVSQRLSNRSAPPLAPEDQKYMASGLAHNLTKARDYKSHDSKIESLLLTSGVSQDVIDAYKEAGSQEFLTTLIEASPKLGGRLSSTLDSTLSELFGSAGIKRQRFTVGGRVQRFVNAGEVKERPSSLLKSLSDRLARVGGIGGVKDLLGISKGSRELDSKLRGLKGVSAEQMPEVSQILRRAEEAKILRVKGKISENRKKREEVDKSQQKGLLFAAVGLKGVKFSAIKKKVGKGILKKPVDVHITSGLLYEESAKKVEKTLAREYNRTNKKLAKEVLVSGVMEDFNAGKTINLDFDRTLALGADKLLSDPTKPEFSEFADESKVQEVLSRKDTKLTKLGRALRRGIQQNPQMASNLRIVTARPQHTMPLIQAWLKQQGLPITDLQGVGGAGISASQIPKRKAKVLKPGVFVDDDIANITEANQIPGMKTHHYKLKKQKKDSRREGAERGFALERIIEALGGPVSLRTKKSIDFPMGLMGAAKHFGVAPNIPTDAKRTLSGPSVIESNVVNYLKAKGYASGGVIQKLADGKRVTASGKLSRSPHKLVPSEKGVGPSPFVQSKQPTFTESQLEELQKEFGLKSFQLPAILERARMFEVKDIGGLRKIAKEEEARRIQRQSQKSNSDPKALADFLQPRPIVPNMDLARSLMPDRRYGGGEIPSQPDQFFSGGGKIQRFAKAGEVFYHGSGGAFDKYDMSRSPGGILGSGLYVALKGGKGSVPEAYARRGMRAHEREHGDLSKFGGGIYPVKIKSGISDFPEANVPLSKDKETRKKIESIFSKLKIPTKQIKDLTFSTASDKILEKLIVKTKSKLPKKDIGDPRSDESRAFTIASQQVRELMVSAGIQGSKRTVGVEADDAMAAVYDENRIESIGKPTLTKDLKEYLADSKNARRRKAVGGIVQEFVNGGQIQKFAKSGVVKAVRRKAIIDSDKFRNIKDPEEAARVAEGMKLLGATTEADYAIKLSALAGQLRESGGLKRFSVMAGAAGNRKTSLAMGRGANDDAKLRQVKRKFVLHPSDLENADEAISLTTTLKQSKLDYMAKADRIYVKDSSTKDEQKLVKFFTKQREDTRDVTLLNRDIGTTKDLSPDYGEQTASILSTFGSAHEKDASGRRGKVVVLGEKTDEKGNPLYRTRIKRGEELPELVSAQAMTSMAASPFTKGHSEAVIGTMLEEARKKNPKATHKDLLVQLAPDLSLSGGSQGMEHGARYGIFPASFRRELIKSVHPDIMVSSADKPSETGINPRIAEIEKGISGRRRFAVAEQGAPVIISKAPHENPEGVMARYSEAGLSPKNIARTADEAGDTISGTAVRQAMISKDYDKLDRAVLPQVSAALKANQPQIRNRSLMVPLVQQSIGNFVEANKNRVNEQINRILASASGGPFTRMTPKFKDSHPDLVKQIQQLRKNRDIFEKEAYGDHAHEVIRQISHSHPDIYGLDIKRSGPTDIAVTENDIKQHIMDSSKLSTFFKSGLSFGSAKPATPTPIEEAIKQTVSSTPAPAKVKAKTPAAAPKGSGDLPTDSKTIIRSLGGLSIPDEPKYGMFAGKSLDIDTVKKVWRKSYPQMAEEKTASYTAVKELLRQSYDAKPMKVGGRVKKFMRGGAVQKFSGGGEGSSVPALVSAGEGWVSPDQVSSFGGYSALHRLNHADKSGVSSSNLPIGNIGVFDGPGTGTSDSIGPVGLEAGGFVIRAAAMEALRANRGGKIQRFATGGTPKPTQGQQKARLFPDMVEKIEKGLLAKIVAIKDQTVQQQLKTKIKSVFGHHAGGAKEIFKFFSTATEQEVAESMSKITALTKEVNSAIVPQQAASTPKATTKPVVSSQKPVLSTIAKTNLAPPPPVPALPKPTTPIASLPSSKISTVSSPTQGLLDRLTPEQRADAQAAFAEGRGYSINNRDIGKKKKSPDLTGIDPKTGLPYGVKSKQAPPPVPAPKPSINPKTGLPYGVQSKQAPPVPMSPEQKAAGWKSREEAEQYSRHLNSIAVGPKPAPPPPTPEQRLKTYGAQLTARAIKSGVKLPPLPPPPRKHSIGGKIQRFSEGQIAKPLTHIGVSSRKGVITAMYLGGGRKGAVQAHDMGDGTWQVKISGVSQKGTGPDLYDAVMREVSKRKKGTAGLTSDRNLVSGDANKIWAGYKDKRIEDSKYGPKVDRTPLDPKHYTTLRKGGHKDTSPLDDPKEYRYSLKSPTPDNIKIHRLGKKHDRAVQHSVMEAINLKRRATGGEIPIMAKEGEFVINEHAAGQIGPHTLKKLNRGGRIAVETLEKLPKYHSGGSVQKLAWGGPVKIKDPYNDENYGFKLGKKNYVQNMSKDDIKETHSVVNQSAANKKAFDVLGASMLKLSQLFGVTTKDLSPFNGVIKQFTQNLKGGMAASEALARAQLGMIGVLKNNDDSYGENFIGKKNPNGPNPEKVSKIQDSAVDVLARAALNEDPIPSMPVSKSYDRSSPISGGKGAFAPRTVGAMEIPLTRGQASEITGFGKSAVAKNKKRKTEIEEAQRVLDSDTATEAEKKTAQKTISSKSKRKKVTAVDEAERFLSKQDAGLAKVNEKRRAAGNSTFDTYEDYSAHIMSKDASTIKSKKKREKLLKQQDAVREATDKRVAAQTLLSRPTAKAIIPPPDPEIQKFEKRAQEVNKRRTRGERASEAPRTAADEAASYQRKSQESLDRINKKREAKGKSTFSTYEEYADSVAKLDPDKAKSPEKREQILKTQARVASRAGKLRAANTLVENREKEKAGFDKIQPIVRNTGPYTRPHRGGYGTASDNSQIRKQRKHQEYIADLQGQRQSTTDRVNRGAAAGIISSRIGGHRLYGASEAMARSAEASLAKNNRKVVVGETEATVAAGGTFAGMTQEEAAAKVSGTKGKKKRNALQAELDNTYGDSAPSGSTRSVKRQQTADRGSLAARKAEAVANRKGTSLGSAVFEKAGMGFSNAINKARASIGQFGMSISGSARTSEGSIKNLIAGFVGLQRSVVATEGKFKGMTRSEAYAAAKGTKGRGARQQALAEFHETFGSAGMKSGRSVATYSSKEGGFFGGMFGGGGGKGKSGSAGGGRGARGGGGGGGGMGMYMGEMALSMAGSAAVEQYAKSLGGEKTLEGRQASNYLGSMVTGASTGMMMGGMIGSVVPGVGTVVGGAIGAGVGAAGGLAYGYMNSKEVDAQYNSEKRQEKMKRESEKFNTQLGAMSNASLSGDTRKRAKNEANQSFMRIAEISAQEQRAGLESTSAFGNKPRLTAEERADSAQEAKDKGISLIEAEMQQTGKSLQEVQASMNPAQWKALESSIADADPEFQKIKERFKEGSGIYKHEQSLAIQRGMAGLKYTEEMIKSARENAKLSQSMQKLNVSFEKMANALDSAAARANKVMENAKLGIEAIDNPMAAVQQGQISKSADILSNPNAYSIEEVEQAARQNAGMAGSSSEAMVQSAVLPRKLETAFGESMQAVKASGVTDTGEADSKARSAVKDAMTKTVEQAFGPEIAGDMKKQIDKFVNEFKGDITQISFDELIKGIPGLADKMAASGKVMEALKSQAQAASNAIAMMGDAASKRAAKGQEMRNMDADTFSTVANSTLAFRRGTGEKISWQADAGVRNQARAIRLGTTADVAADPRKMLDRYNKLKEAKDQAVINQQQVSEANRPAMMSGDKQASTDAIGAMSNAARTTTEFAQSMQQARDEIKALPGDIKENISGIMQELQDAMQERNAKIGAASGFMEKMLTSTPQGMKKMGNTFNNLNQTLAGRGVSFEESYSANTAYNQVRRQGGNHNQAQRAAQEAYAQESSDTLSMAKELAPLLGAVDPNAQNQMMASVYENMFKARGQDPSQMMVGGKSMQEYLDMMKKGPAEDPKIAALKQALESQQSALQAANDAAKELIAQEAEALTTKTNQAVLDAMTAGAAAVKVAVEEAFKSGITMPGEAGKGKPGDAGTPPMTEEQRNTRVDENRAAIDEAKKVVASGTASEEEKKKAEKTILEKEQENAVLTADTKGRKNLASSADSMTYEEHKLPGETAEEFINRRDKLKKQVEGTPGTPASQPTSGTQAQNTAAGNQAANPAPATRPTGTATPAPQPAQTPTSATTAQTTGTANQTAAPGKQPKHMTDAQREKELADEKVYEQAAETEEDRKFSQHKQAVLQGKSKEEIAESVYGVKYEDMKKEDQDILDRDHETVVGDYTSKYGSLEKPKPQQGGRVIENNNPNVVHSTVPGLVNTPDDFTTGNAQTPAQQAQAKEAANPTPQSYANLEAERKAAASQGQAATQAVGINGPPKPAAPVAAATQTATPKPAISPETKKLLSKKNALGGAVASYKKAAEENPDADSGKTDKEGKALTNKELYESKKAEYDELQKQYDATPEAQAKKQASDLKKENDRRLELTGRSDLSDDEKTELQTLKDKDFARNPEKKAKFEARRKEQERRSLGESMSSYKEAAEADAEGDSGKTDETGKPLTNKELYEQKKGRYEQLKAEHQAERQAAKAGAVTATQGAATAAANQASGATASGTPAQRPGPMGLANVHQEAQTRGMTAEEVNYERQQQYLSQFNPETRAAKEKSMGRGLLKPSERQLQEAQNQRAAAQAPQQPGAVPPAGQTPATTAPTQSTSGQTVPQTAPASSTGSAAYTPPSSTGAPVSAPRPLDQGGGQQNQGGGVLNTSGLEAFTTKLDSLLTKLGEVNIPTEIRLTSENIGVNVTLNGGEVMKNLPDTLAKHILAQAGEQLRKYDQAGSGEGLTGKTGILGQGSAQV